MSISTRLRHFTYLLPLLFGMGAAVVTMDARADIYGYIDNQGMSHFATEKLDQRYQLFMHGSAYFDSSKLSTGSSNIKFDPNFSKTPLYHYLSQHPGLKKYEIFVNQAAKEFKLDPALLKAVMATESGFNPTAVSAKGAIGLMQIMPDTAERYGMVGDQKKTIQEKLSDPRTNIRLGARYLRDLILMFPLKQELVIASYNAGEGSIKKYNNQIPPYPETRNYVQIVSQFYQIYRPAGIIPVSDSMTSGNANRIHVTLPGRRNMPDGTKPLLD
ncbi:lytic transglycosylase domain-containing protein [Glaciimonas soli]|nr:lytic transglycosylase domain-containing protein [Glaciimonas soli]